MTAGAVASAPVSPFAVFRNRSFAWMWSGQLVSTIGSLCILMLRIKPLAAQERDTVRMVLPNVQTGVRFLFVTPILR
jgi:hypothetical protein